MFGIVVATVVPCVVLRALSSCHVWCCRHCRCTVCGVAGTVVVLHMVLWALLSHRVGVVVGIISPHMMLRELLSCRVWCCLGCCCAVHGVGGAVIVPRVMLGVLSLHCVGVMAGIVLPCVMS